MFDASLLNVLKPSQSLHKAPVRRTYLVLPSSIGLGRVRHISRLVGAARRCRCPRCVPDGRTVFGFAIALGGTQAVDAAQPGASVSEISSTFCMSVPPHECRPD